MTWFKVYPAVFVCWIIVSATQAVELTIIDASLSVGSEEFDTTDMLQRECNALCDTRRRACGPNSVVICELNITHAFPEAHNLCWHQAAILKGHYVCGNGPSVRFEADENLELRCDTTTPYINVSSVSKIVSKLYKNLFGQPDNNTDSRPSDNDDEKFGLLKKEQ